MKIFIADSLHPKPLEILQGKYDVTFSPKIKDVDLPLVIADHEILIVRSTEVIPETIDAGKSLKLIIRAGSGYNTICCDYAAEKGVAVCNTPGTNAAAVAELAIMHMISCDRHPAAQRSQLIDGHWAKNAFTKASGFYKRTLGVMGRGSIATRIIKAAQALGMNIVQWSGRLTPEQCAEMGTTFCATPLDLARQSDAISLNLAKTDDTMHIVNAEFLTAMRDGAILVNTSRGELIDTPALLKAIDTKGLRVGLDVYEDEPTVHTGAPFEQTELVRKCCSCTMHIGASTDEATLTTALEAIRVIDTYATTGEFTHRVN
eukprot:gnl/Chilomastix_cuspidata/94.p1 GENE.gnl/Chilomastix_cuspidata/94~~gnl/Chilomastix_cuspidata/94.p1  ORF type:complete len:317 (-),score=119.06 gnl/Chilomastix_cuspidata/94:40-990(-)